jgi:diguanylate cyclase (GGDEF)-like protein
MKRSAPRTLLLVEDNAGDARLLREMLNEHGMLRTTLVHVTSVGEAEAHLADNAVDIILLDLGLPDAQGLQAVGRIRAAASGTPLVVLTGLDDETLAGQALQEGAQDYIIKGQIDTRGLLRALRYAVERKSMEEKAREMALQVAHSAEHDFLTGLPNRVLLNDRINFAIALAARHKKKLAVLFMDLDGFKHVNDSLGHSTGDKLLESIAARLVACVRTADTVSRQGGDEFVILLSEIEHAEEAATIANRVLQAVADSHSIGEMDLYVTASVGVSIYPDDGADAETLVKNADTAMYQAKAMGRQTFQFFTPVMNARAVERQSIEADLRRALQRRELVLHYQPKVDLTTGAITGAEALVRWMHPGRGSISPAQFIPVAEDCGLIVPIGAWVLGEATRRTKSWVAAGLNPGTIAVNVSAMQFRRDSFVEHLFEILAETGLDPELLELELTETVLMTRGDSTAAVLQTLRDGGVQIAMDDFGTGYSNLSYLQKFPVDCLKIDQSFIRQISTAGQEVALVTAIINMAHTLNLRVVAEGVETKDEAAFLEANGCDQAQGNYFSVPVVAKAFAELLERQIADKKVCAGDQATPLHPAATGRSAASG